MFDSLLSIILIIFIIGLIFLLFLGIYFPRKRKKFILDNSHRVKCAYQCNEEYRPQFLWDIQTQIIFSCECKSKHAFDVFNEYRFFEEKIDQDRVFYQTIVSQIENNKDVYSRYSLDYKQKINLVMPIKSPKEKNSKKYQKIEDRIIQHLLLSPPLNIQMSVTYSYESPKHRNYYTLTKHIEYIQIHQIFEKLVLIDKKRSSVQAERAKMSDSLRYDIMKRDHFRCVLCGASQNDGVKLHVDHIIPVSKGGKTEIKNLRTLCERCNLGKKAKYDPNGFN